MKVSIIVPCFRHPELAQQVVEGVAKTTDVDFELILVDNGNGVPDNLPLHKYKWLRVVQSHTNLGFGGGNNLGAWKSSGDVLLFLNSDMVIDDPNWLKQFLNAYEKNPKSIIGDELVKQNDWTFVRGKHHEYINGHAIMMSRKFFDEVGGWDTDFGLGYFEDVWICQEALKRGYQLVEVKVGITHLGSKTVSDGFFDIDKLMLKSSYHFRDKVIKSQIPKDKLRIVFMSQGNYKFSDGSLNGKGVGGAEQAFILLTRALAKQGHLVEVYNDPEKMGFQNGVYYHKVDEFRYSDYADVFVCFRNPIRGIADVNAKVKLFWSCDQYTVGHYDHNVIPFYDKIICISEFHKKYFLKNYNTTHHQIEVIGLGVNLPDYANKIPKVKGKMIYCSVPHRGLDKLLELFPLIKRQVPFASLYITSDYTLWGANPDNEVFREQARYMKDVHFLGNIPRQELIKHQLESEVMAYPCVYDENFCISAAECIVAGAVPVTTKRGALPTTVGQDGYLTKSDAEFVDTVVNVLLNQSKTIFGTSRKRFDYDHIAKQWEKLIYSLYKENMLKLEPRLPKNTEKLTVLDLGCGIFDSGISEQIPLIKFKSYVGVDAWEQSLKQAEKHDMKTTIRTFVLSDILDFVEKEENRGKFDLIFLFDVLEHFNKKDGLKILEAIKKMSNKRIVMFMPLGDHTLEANDGFVKNNPYQKHKSEWTAKELQELGFDTEVYKGFHHSGILDAAWIIKDTNYMKICEDCGSQFNSAYFFDKHKLTHGNSDVELLDKVPLATDVVITKMPDVKLKLKHKVEISVNSFVANNTDEIIIPYYEIADKMRILQDAYGMDIVISQEFVEMTD